MATITVTGTTISTIVSLDATNNVLTVSGTGTISVASDAVYGTSKVAGTVLNSGKIVSTGLSSNGVHLVGGGTITNNSGATIQGAFGVSSYINATTAAASLTVVNAGTILSSGATAAASSFVGIGAFVAGGGALTNLSGGVIRGDYGIYGGTTTSQFVNTGSIAGTSWMGVWINGGGTLTNNAGGVIVGGTRTGAGAYGGFAAGVHLKSGGLIANQGQITDAAAAGVGISLSTGGTISNTGTGYVLGNSGVIVTGGGATIANAGTIKGSGGVGVSLATGVTNRVIASPGAVFVGTVNGGTALNATLELASSASAGTITGLGSSFKNFGTVTFDTGSKWTVVASSAAAPSYTFVGFGAGDTIDISGFTATNIGSAAAGSSVTLSNGGATEVLKFSGAVGGGFNIATAIVNGATVTQVTTVCFCRGTRILTPDGDVEIQNLRPGDLVATVGADSPRAIVWVGAGKVLATRGRRGPQTPVIVRKGALADGVPGRDLRVTKAHALLFDDILVPVEFLVNHRSILWDDQAQEVEIYHIELETHDAIFAEGAPAETFRDDGNRWMFQNAHERETRPPEVPCFPVLTGGPEVDAIWTRLRDRAGLRDIALTDDADPHLIVDGQRIDATHRAGPNLVFDIPFFPETIRIASRDAVPAELGIARDSRSLGLALRQIAIQLGRNRASFAADDPRLSEGFHEYEADEDIRWTAGDAALPPAMFAALGLGPLTVVLTLGASTRYRDFGETAAGRAA